MDDAESNLHLSTKCQFINGPYTSSRFDAWYAVADDCSYSAEHNRAKLCTVHVWRGRRVYLNLTEFLHVIFSTTYDRQPLWNVKTDGVLFIDLNFIILRTNSSWYNINIKYIIYGERRSLYFRSLSLFRLGTCSLCIRTSTHIQQYT